MDTTEHAAHAILEGRRDKLRSSGKRLTFDCFNLKQGLDERATCSRGYGLSHVKGGSVSILFILKGGTPDVCKHCKDFDS